mgnify:CR=1 FL=1
MIEEQKALPPRKALKDDDLRSSKEKSSQPSNQQNKSDYELPRRSTDLEATRAIEQQQRLREEQKRELQSTPVKTEDRKDSYLQNVQIETAQKQQQSIS